MLLYYSIMNEKNSKMVEEMFAYGAHFGYSKSKRHPSCKDFVYGTKNSYDIINLEKTEEQITKAKEKLKEIFAKKGRVIFVASKAEIKDLAPEIAKCENISYVNSRWIGGTLTNFGEIRKRVNKLKKLMDDSEKGEFSKYTKKEALGFEKEIIKLKKYYFGLLDLVKKPDAIVVVDAKDESIAVKEAKNKGVEVIALANTDTDISVVDYPIVINDRSRDALEFVSKELFSDCK